MRNLRKRYVVGAALICLMVAPSLAAPADQIKTRQAGLKQLGAEFKKLNDGLRASSPDVAVLRAAARGIAQAAGKMPGWFPAGSGPKPGLKTAAKAEIWAKPSQFRAAQAAFANQAAALQRAATSGNVDAIKAEGRKLGGTCKGCHDNFRVPQD